VRWAGQVQHRHDAAVLVSRLSSTVGVAWWSPVARVSCPRAGESDLTCPVGRVDRIAPGVGIAPTGELCPAPSHPGRKVEGRHSDVAKVIGALDARDVADAYVCRCTPHFLPPSSVPGARTPSSASVSYARLPIHRRTPTVLAVVRAPSPPLRPTRSRCVSVGCALVPSLGDGSSATLTNLVTGSWSPWVDVDPDPALCRGGFRSAGPLRDRLYVVGIPGVEPEFAGHPL
jgi:hypothetical protein